MRSPLSVCLLLLLAALQSGCQVVILVVRPPIPFSAVDSSLTINQSLYKANAGKDNQLDQFTDADSVIPASLLGEDSTQ